MKYMNKLKLILGFLIILKLYLIYIKNFYEMILDHLKLLKKEGFSDYPNC